MDTSDYQRSTLPSRLPATRGMSLPAQRYAAATPAEVVGPSPLSTRVVLRASRRYWWLILALWTVGVSGLGALIYLKVHPQYHSLALLKVDPNALDLYGSSNQFGGVSYMHTYVELIKSPTVFSAAIEDPEVARIPRIRDAGDPFQELTKSIQVGIRPNTTLIEVSMTSPSADEAATVVNAVVQKFIRANKTWSGESVRAQYDKLKGYYDDLKAQGKRIEDDIRVLAARGAMNRQVVRKSEVEDKAKGKPGDTNWDVDHYQKMVNLQLETKTELIMAEARLIEAQRVLEESSRLAAAGGPRDQIDPRLELRVNADPEVQNLGRLHREAYNRWQDILKKAVAGRGDPAALKAAAKCNELKLAAEQARSRARQRLQGEILAAGGSTRPEEDVQRIQAEVKQLTVRYAALESQIGSLKLESNKQMTEEVEVRFLEDRRRFVDSNANMIKNRLDGLDMERMNEERIYLIDAARKEGRPISDKRKMYMAATPFGVLGIVLALAVLLEIRSGRVSDPEILSVRMPHEVFAIAPLPSTRPAIGAEADRNEQRLARFVQSLDHLRVALCEGGTNGEGRCVMITSATGGEGKTTLSAHLAARCANAGTATLLIDADLRRGSLGRLLDVPAGPGLGDVLAGQVELDGGLISTQAGGFHFLSAGTPGIDPTRVLRSTRLAELIGQLRQMYDLVIIDTPPVLPVADALILGRWADGAVMAARYDASRLPLVERANRQIAAAGIPVLGVVINGVKGQDQAYGNYAYNYASPGSRDPFDSVDDAS